MKIYEKIFSNHTKMNDPTRMKELCFRRSFNLFPFISIRVSSTLTLNDLSSSSLSQLMTTANTKCSICKQDNGTFPCRGCSEYFCYDQSEEHRQTLNAQINQIRNDYNLFRQTLIEQKNNPHKHSLIQEINQWENDSIDKIR